jgi:hypothetical protein
MLLNFPHLVKKLRVESVGNAIAVSEALLEQVTHTHTHTDDDAYRT